MKLKPINKAYTAAIALSASLLLSACGGGSSSTNPATNTPAAISYSVNIVNTTNNQPLSPVAVISHTADYSAWSIGNPASTELENIAEGGSNSQLLASLTGIDATSVSGAGAIGPGGNQTITITPSATSQTLITIATMLVNANDAFSGINAIDVSQLTSGESMTVNAKIYDAGTELNSESAGTMPGPADGGEGFNANRTDINNVVRSHGGVVTSSDGLTTSVLNQSHKFDNPGMIVTITRQ